MAQVAQGMSRGNNTSPEENESNGRWTRQEHERFLFGMKLFPNGPWKHVAVIVKTRTVRQLRTHAQKYRAKLARHEKKLQRLEQTAHDDSTGKGLPRKPTKRPKIEPIKFTDSSIQQEDCIEFLVDAFRDDLRATEWTPVPPTPPSRLPSLSSLLVER
ncbi:hypothetical protein AeMF1_011975 [Aphanomyces euteiches]|nr:hypothetical protein AeMF1_011975 [Aphanomyces euteiches]KAH9187338.1 hypothetical protein AeNC1_010688 [Aphanomyces euteiches]